MRLFGLKELRRRATSCATSSLAQARGATVSVRALMMGESSLRVDAAFTPGGLPIDGELHLVLSPVPLERLNGLLRSRFGIDVSTGTLGLVFDLDAMDGAKASARLRRSRTIEAARPRMTGRASRYCEPSRLTLRGHFGCGSVVAAWRCMPKADSVNAGPRRRLGRRCDPPAVGRLSPSD